MSKLKPIFESLHEAAVRGARRADLKLHQLADNHADQLDDWVKKIRDKDKFDDKPDAPKKPDAHKPGDGSGGATYRPDMSRKPASMTDEEYLRLLDASVHNPDGVEAVLGKFRVEGTQSYIEVAEGRKPPATYFSLGDDWGTIADAHDLDDRGMFDAFNVPFLDKMIAEGKAIRFSHNPQDFPGSALADELEYLERRGYRFDVASMQAIPRDRGRE